jgi:hypothetical protein
MSLNMTKFRVRETSTRMAEMTIRRTRNLKAPAEIRVILRDYRLSSYMFVRPVSV